LLNVGLGMLVDKGWAELDGAVYHLGLGMHPLTAQEIDRKERIPALAGYNAVEKVETLQLLSARLDASARETGQCEEFSLVLR